MKLSGDIGITSEKVDKEIANWEKYHPEHQKKLEELFKENKIKMNKVESNLLKQKNTTPRVYSIFKSDECD